MTHNLDIVITMTVLVGLVYLCDWLKRKYFKNTDRNRRDW